MPTYSFQTNATLKKIAQEKVPVLVMSDPIFQFFPIRTENSDTVMWEQKDSFRGLQQVRGIGGQFSSVQTPSIGRFIVTPGYYGDKVMIDEQRLTRLRNEGTFGDTIDASTLVLEAQELLLNREIDRMRQIAWNMTGGRFSVQSATGAILHTDVFPIQGIDFSGTQDGRTSGGTGGAGYSTVYSFTMSNWATASTATPLKDLRNVPIIGRGRGVRLDSGATMFMNRVTFNYFINNANSADLRGTLINVLGAGVNMIGVEMYNEKVSVAADLPKIVIYDEVYLDASGNAVPFLPDGDVRVFGMRVDGNELGAFVQTRNASNQGQAPGPYDASIESREPPITIGVFRGVNYAPIIEYPGSVVRLRVNGTSFGQLT